MSAIATETLQVPKEQKAWVVEGRGEPSKVLKLKENVPVSTKLQKGEVLVKVQAAALNPVGHKMMRLAPNFILKRPYVPEHDFAGVVVDANGTEFVNGQEVFGYVPGGVQTKTRQGTLAQYVRAPAEFVAPRPANLSAVEAAGFTLAGLTSYHALFAVCKLEPGQSVFVNGGSTACGIFAIQLAKAIGCTVGASASTQRKEFLESLGVDRFIDYTKGPVHAQLSADPPTPKYHIFLEAVGNTDVELFTRSADYLAPGGVFISLGPQPEGPGKVGQMVRYVWETLLKPKVFGGTPRTWKVLVKQPTPDQMKPFAQLIAEGKVKPVVDSTFAFEDVQKAYERILTKRACGKVVVKVDPEAH